jgi:hypothetical protein
MTARRIAKRQALDVVDGNLETDHGRRRRIGVLAAGGRSLAMPTFATRRTQEGAEDICMVRARSKCSLVLLPVIGILLSLFAWPGLRASAAPGDDLLTLDVSVISTDSDGDGDATEVEPGALMDWTVRYASLVGARSDVPIVAMFNGQSLTGPVEAAPGWQVEYTQNGSNWDSNPAYWPYAIGVRALADVERADASGAVQYQVNDVFDLPTAPLFSQGSGDGDGYTPMVVGTRVYAVAHHADHPKFSCVDTSRGGAPCPGYPRNFAHPSSNFGMTGVAVGTELWFSYHDANGDFGFYCWNTSGDAACGEHKMGTDTDVETSVPGNNQIGFWDSVSRPQAIDTRVYFASGEGEMHCWDTATDLVCAGFPVAHGLGEWAYHPADLEAIGGRLYLAKSTAGKTKFYGEGTSTMTCFEPAGTLCGGDWSVPQSVTGIGLFPRTDAAGVEDGVCSRPASAISTRVQCYDLDGSNPSDVWNVYLPTYQNFEALVEARVGSRVFSGRLTYSSWEHAWYCHDWATGNCGTPARTSFYGVSVLSGNCLIGLGDPGQYDTINAVTLVSPCHPPISTVKRKIARSQYQCSSRGSTVPMTWKRVELKNVDLRPGVEFEAFDVVVKDGSGNTLSGPHNLIGTDGVVPLSGNDPVREFEIFALPVGTGAWDDEVFPTAEYTFSGPPADWCFKTAISTRCHLVTGRPADMTVTGALGPSRATRELNVSPGSLCDASVNGIVYNDFDGNGAHDPGEQLLADVPIYVYDTRDWTQGIVQTDAEGRYSFLATPGAQYYLFVGYWRLGSGVTATESPFGPGQYGGYINSSGVLGEQDFGLQVSSTVDLAVTSTSVTGAPGQTVVMPFQVSSESNQSNAQTLTIDVPASLEVVESALPRGCVLTTPRQITCAVGYVDQWSPVTVPIPLRVAPDAVPATVYTLDAAVAPSVVGVVDNNSLNDTTQATVTVDAPVVDLEIAVVGFDAKRNATGELALTVENNGPSNSSGSTVTITIPAHLQLGVLPVGCTAVGNDVNCILGALTLEDRADITIPVTMAIDAPVGRVTSPASVSGVESDPVERNDLTTYTVGVLAPEVDLAVTSTSLVGVPGSTVNVTYTVSNAGTDPSGGATVTITPPSNLIVGTLPAECAMNGTSIVCTTGALVPTGSVGIVIRYTIPPGTLPGPLDTGVARAVPTASEEIDVISANDRTPTSAAVVDPIPIDLAIEIGAVAGPPGTTQIAAVKVTNRGPGDAFGEQIVLTAPPGITFDTALSPSGCTATSPTQITCVVSPLGSGSSVVVAIPVVLPDGSPSGIFGGGQGSVSPTSTQNIDTVEANNTASFQVEIIYNSDLALTGGDVSLFPGNRATYDVLVVNNGPQPAAEVVVSITIPTGLNVGLGLPEGCVVIGSATGRCTIGTMERGATRRLSMPVSAPTGASPGVLPTGSAVVSFAGRDLEPTNDTGWLTATIDEPGPRQGGKLPLTGSSTARLMLLSAFFCVIGSAVLSATRRRPVA